MNPGPSSQAQRERVPHWEPREQKKSPRPLLPLAAARAPTFPKTTHFLPCLSLSPSFEPERRQNPSSGPGPRPRRRHAAAAGELDRGRHAAVAPPRRLDPPAPPPALLPAPRNVSFLTPRRIYSVTCGDFVGHTWVG